MVSTTFIMDVYEVVELSNYMGHINVIFLANDDASNAIILSDTELADISIDTVSSESELVEAISAIQYNVAIIDVGVPELVNLDIITSLRETTSLGIIAVTSGSSSSTRIVSYENGADQFFTAPVDNLELTAAIRNLNSRLQSIHSASEPTAKDKENKNGKTHWLLNKRSWCLLSPDNHEVKLTAKEVKFLELLMSQVGENVLRKALRKSLGYSADDYGSRSIDSMVRRLRKKVLAHLSIPLPLQTVHAVGYCFSAPAQVLGNQLRP